MFFLKENSFFYNFRFNKVIWDSTFVIIKSMFSWRRVDILSHGIESARPFLSIFL